MRSAIKLGDGRGLNPQTRLGRRRVSTTRYKVALLQVFTPETLAEVEAELPRTFDLLALKTYDEQEILDAVSDADFILTGEASVPVQVIKAAPKLKLIHKYGVGYDKIDVGTAAERGIPVAIAAGANATPVAEHAIMLMLAVYRKLPYVDRSIRLGRWSKYEIRAVTYQLSGKTVGLVGLGHIGREVARRVRAFDTRVISYTRHPSSDVGGQLGVEFRSLDELLAESDVISLHVPLTRETRKLVDERAFSVMKRSAIVINTSRGGVIDEPALVEALQSGRILGAGLDVFALEPPGRGNPLLELENVVLTNHCAGGVLDNVRNIARQAFGNMIRIVNGQPLDEADVVGV